SGAGVGCRERLSVVTRPYVAEQLTCSDGTNTVGAVLSGAVRRPDSPAVWQTHQRPLLSCFQTGSVRPHHAYHDLVPKRYRSSHQRGGESRPARRTFGLAGTRRVRGHARARPAPPHLLLCLRRSARSPPAATSCRQHWGLGLRLLWFWEVTLSQGAFLC